MSNLAKRVLLTGASGFLGSHIAEALVLNGFSIIATKRNSSDLWRCETYKDEITWVNVDCLNWQQTVVEFAPSLIVHCAWIGVSAADRLNWTCQLSNISLVHELLELVVQLKPKLFIGFGSQAEYGTFEGKVKENHPINPITAYGTVKAMIYELVKGFFFQMTSKETRWYWLRLFSFYGEREDKNWLIPFTIHELIANNSINLTMGEQEYAYLYVKDLSKMLLQLIFSDAMSGVYNISSSHPISIKSLLERLSWLVNSRSTLNFGALPYRPGQAMHIEGDMTKFRDEVGAFTESDLNFGLRSTIQFFTNK